MKGFSGIFQLSRLPLPHLVLGMVAALALSTGLLFQVATPAHATAATIQIVKLTNAQDTGDNGPGPEVPVCGQVTWTYMVSIVETGDALPITMDKVFNASGTGSGLVDDGGPNASFSPTYVGGDVRNFGFLDPANPGEGLPGEVWTFTASGTPIPGPYKNTVVATGYQANPAPDGTFPPVIATDVSHYKGVPCGNPAINIVKFTNGQDADSPPGPQIPVGGAVNWTYKVSNVGNVALSNIVVTDDQGVAVTCPATTLAVGGSMTCTGNGTAVAGQYANVGKACGDGAGQTVCDDNPSHYFGNTPTPGLGIEKTADKQTIEPYEVVVYSYKVTNTGQTTLTNIVVTDDNGTPAYTGDDFTVGTVPSLGPGLSMTLMAQVIPEVCTGAVVSGNTVNAGAIIVVVTQGNGDIKVTYLQDFGINDNTYGTGAIGWPSGHTFGNLTGSDKLEFRFFDKNSNVVLDFYLDSITAATKVTVPGTGQVIMYPSGYGTLGPFGGDGFMVAGDPNNIVTFSTSITENLNIAANLPNKAALIVNSPTSLVGGNVVVDPVKAPGGWNHINTYMAIIKASTFGSAGFGLVTVPDQHNSPNKLNAPHQMSTMARDCMVINTATARSGNLTATDTAAVHIVVASQATQLTAGAPTVKDKQVKQVITNNGSTKATVVGVTITWPSTNGYLSKVKLDGDVIWDGTISCAGGICSATLTSAQLTADLKKKSINAGAARTLTFEFEKNAAAVVGNNYTWTVNFDTDGDGIGDNAVTYP